MYQIKNTYSLEYPGKYETPDYQKFFPKPRTGDYSENQSYSLRQQNSNYNLF